MRLTFGSLGVHSASSASGAARSMSTLVAALALVLPILAPSWPALAAVPPDGSGKPEYKLGAGDELRIFVYETKEDHTVLVRPDGRISIPLVGDIAAEGRSARELADQVRAALEPYQQPATVTVSVQAIHSYRIYMLGQLGAQGMIESQIPMRLLQALAHAGGLTTFATKNILVLREGPKGQERIQIDYEKILSGKSPEMDIWLKSGDVVVSQ